MKTRKNIETRSSFPDILSVSSTYALMSLGRAAYTLFATPDHVKLHQVVEGARIDGPHQPIHPSVEETTRRLREEVLPGIDLATPVQVDRARLTHLGGALIQFADYIPKLHNTISVPYDTIHQLHEAVTERARETGPLGYAEQLDVALQSTNGDMIESLWRLFITSRFYARWLDSKIIDGIPDLTQDEKVALMLEWRGAIAACKEPGPGIAQDPNGDTYYTWTHALAKTAYSLTPQKNGAFSRGVVRTFEHGTHIMHKVVHTFNQQGVKSNHDLAASYGNEIGQTVVDAIRSK